MTEPGPGPGPNVVPCNAERRPQQLDWRWTRILTMGAHRSTASERTGPGMAEATERLPILVLGLMPRTGTNFLARLLAIHVDGTSPTTLYEDFLVRGLPQLQDYIQTVSDCWQPHWPSHNRLDELRDHLGGALVRFLQEDAKTPTKRPIFKSPSVIGIDLIDRFMPQLDVVIVLRQGPATIESGMRSFGWDFETACRRWGAAAKTVLNVSRQRQEQGLAPFTRVRYEDLATDTEFELRKVLSQIELDPAAFDFDRVADFPVFGSSQQKDVRWEPVAMSADFDPLARAARWPAGTFERFDRVSGSLSADLGYQQPHRYSRTTISALRQSVQDARHLIPRRIQNLLCFKS